MTVWVMSLPQELPADRLVLDGGGLADRDILLVLGDRVERVSEAQLDLDLGIERGEVSQHGRQQVLRRYQIGRQADAARCFAVERLHLVEAREQRRLGLERLRQQAVPGGGQGQAVRAPPEELGAELRLERLDLRRRVAWVPPSCSASAQSKPCCATARKAGRDFQSMRHPDRFRTATGHYSHSSKQAETCIPMADLGIKEVP